MPNQNPPQCPKCGAAMVLRTARNGKFSGRQFYGCPNWKTTCKGIIINLDNDADLQSNDNASIGLLDNIINQSVFLDARERFENYRTLFFQNLAVPKELLDKVNQETISREQVLFYSQWRLDFPEKAIKEVSKKERLVLLVTKKILTRGRITLLSPSLEKKLRETLKPEFDDAPIDLSQYLGLIKHNQSTTAWFDGKTIAKLDGKKPEHFFYEDILQEHLGPYFKKFILPQVYFSSFAGASASDNPTSFQRVDFLITTPDKSFVVELDDPNHIGHESRDDNRINLLRSKGFQTIRINNDELIEKNGQGLNELSDALKGCKVSAIESISDTDKYLLAVKLAYQFQLTFLESLLAGVFSLNKEKVTICFDSSSVTFSKNETDIIISAAFDDLMELLKNLCELYEIENIFTSLSVTVSDNIENTSDPVITFNENCSKNTRCLIIQDISFPYTIAHNEERLSRFKIANPQEQVLKYFLNYVFRFEYFLEGQSEAIRRALQGKDAVVLLPTGAGKSIAFQLASLVLPGVTIVIDPITALIDDQKENLFRKGIDRVEGITGQVEGRRRSQLIQSFSQGEYIFCYIAPERLQIDEFRNNLKSLTVNTPISLIAIDEAHCVSEWGHDFRTAYLNIGRTTRECCTSHGQVPPLLALTGTASNAVLRDVLRELEIKDFEAIITPKTFDREELHFAVFECNSDQKPHVLRTVFQQFLPNKMRSSFNSFFRSQKENTNCGIVFCPHAGGSYGVIENSNLISSLGVESKFYSGGKPKEFTAQEDWTNFKRRTASGFKNNKFPVLVATKSFGMGIDKPNIRFTVHVGLPSSIESYYQEAGRAGRDRGNAHSVLILSNDFKERTKKLLHPDATIEQLNRIMKEERDFDTDDDVTRALWFHLNAFRGVDKELIDIEYIMSQIGGLESPRKINVVFNRGVRNNLEKSVHRLLLLGIINDYTIDYATEEFRIRISGIEKEMVIDQCCRYIEGYNRGRVAQERAKLLEYIDQPFNSFVLKAAQILIAFIYDTIEKGRRRAFVEILSMAEEAASTSEDQDNLIRQRVLRYLETTHSEEIQQVLDDVGSFNNLKIIFDGGVKSSTGEMIGGVRSSKDAAEIRGQVARYLESYPDHPGLLYLRALSEIYCTNPDIEIAYQNIQAACDFSFSRYQISKDKLYDILTWVLEKIYNVRKSVYNDFVVRLFDNLSDHYFNKALISYPAVDREMLSVPSICVFHNLSQRAIEIINS